MPAHGRASRRRMPHGRRAAAMIELLQPRLAMSTAVSPLAPKHFPDMPAIAGVRFATAEAGIRYKDRTDVLLALFDQGTDGRRRLHPLEMPVGAGRLVPRASSRAARRARWSSIPATPTPSPARTAARPTQLTGEARRQGGRLQARRGLPRLDRRDRRAARRQRVRRRAGRPRREARAPAAGSTPPRRS